MTPGPLRTELDRSRIDREPYPHVVIPEAFSDYRRLEDDFPDSARFAGHIRSHGDLTYPDQEYCRLIRDSEAYRNLHEWVHSPSFCRSFLDLFRSDIESHVATGALLLDPLAIPIRPQPYEGRAMIGRAVPTKSDAFLFPRLDLGIGRVGYGKVNGGKGVHVDNLTRVVSILVYVGDNPSMVGGEHRLYGLDGHEPVVKKVYRPRPNMLLASLQSNLALHDVNPVAALVGVRKAFYMAVSCSTEIWRPPADRRLARLTSNRYRKTLLERIRTRLRRPASKGFAEPS
jgi:hypothetical protein